MLCFFPPPFLSHSTPVTCGYYQFRTKEFPKCLIEHQIEQQILLPDDREIPNNHSEKLKVTHLLRARPAAGPASFWRLLPSLGERLRWKGQAQTARVLLAPFFSSTASYGSRLPWIDSGSHRLNLGSRRARSPAAGVQSHRAWCNGQPLPC